MKSYATTIYSKYQSVGLSRNGGSEKNNRQAKYWRWKVLSWLSDVPRNANIVDLGCGNGDFLRFLAGQGFTRLTGVDISSEQVASADSGGVVIISNDIFLFVQGLPENAVDIVILFDVIEHVSRDEILDLLGRLYGRLKPGGQILIQTPNGESPFHGAVYWADPTHETLLTPNSLAVLLKISGFQNIRHQETTPPACNASLGGSLHLVGAAQASDKNLQ